MVKRVLKFLSQEISGLHKAAYLLAFFTFLSQLLGILRDRLLANQFGAGLELDLYYAAFRIPDLIFITAASVVSISVLVPFLINHIQRGAKETRAFIDAAFSFFSLFIVGVSAVTFSLTPTILKFVFPSFLDASDNGASLVTLTRIMLLSPILLGLSNFFASITQAKSRFSAYAISPVLYNLGIIGGVIVFYPAFGISGLGFGVVLGALLHLLVQIPFIVRNNLFPRFALRFQFEVIRGLVRLSLSRSMALSAGQLSTLVLIAMAAAMTAGSVTVFSFAWNLQSVPLSLIGVSYTVALFPTISRLFGSGEKDEFAREMAAAARHIIFWTLPLTVLFIVLRAQIVRVALGSGFFDWQDTRLTAAALALFVVSVLAQSLILLFVRGYYAGGNTRKPLLVNVIGAVLAVVFSLGLSRIFEVSPIFRYFWENLLRVPDLPGSEILMLPLGFSLAMIFNAAIFWFYFHRRFVSTSRLILNAFFEVFSASVIIGFVSYKFLGVFDNIFDINTFVGIFMQGFLSGVIGIAAGIGVLVLLKNREVKEVWTTLHHKIWKAKVIVPEQESL